MSTRHSLIRDPRVKQLAVGIGSILLVCLVVAFIWMGGNLPGFAGEFFAMVLGIITTPFLMEGSFLVLGLLIVIALNVWRQKRDGDEFVYLEQAEGPGSESLPESARWAIYDDRPLDFEDPEAQSLIEGALEIGDHQGAVEILAEMTGDERAKPEILKLRILLAEQTGKDELADRLRGELANQSR